MVTGRECPLCRGDQVTRGRVQGLLLRQEVAGIRNVLVGEGGKRTSLGLALIGVLADLRQLRVPCLLLHVLGVQNGP